MTSAYYRGDSYLVNQENIACNAPIQPNEKEDNEKCRQFGMNITNMQKQAVISEKERRQLKAKHSTMIKYISKAKLAIDNGIPHTFKPNYFSIEDSVKDNPQYLYDYSQEIYAHLLENQSLNAPNYGNITSIQTKVTPRHRRVLVEWLMKIHFRFNFLNDTLYLTVNLLDRYLSSFNLPLSDLQLLGITALFLASKYEEIYPPEAREFSFLTSNKVRAKDIIKMEYRLLKVLHFDIMAVSTNAFITRYHFLSGLNAEVLYLSQFLSEFALLSISCLDFPHSVKAASALLLSIKILHIESSGDAHCFFNEGLSSSTPWTNSLRLITGFAEEDLRDCKRSLLKLIKKRTEDASTLIRKYSAKQYMNVSRFFKEKSA